MGTHANRPITNYLAVIATVVILDMNAWLLFAMSLGNPELGCAKILRRLANVKDPANECQSKTPRPENPQKFLAPVLVTL